MAVLKDYPTPAGSLIKNWVGTGGAWNWRTNLGETVEMLLPSTPQESLTAGVMNIGMAGLSGKVPIKGVKRAIEPPDPVKIGLQKEFEDLGLDVSVKEFNFVDREHELADIVADHWYSKPEENLWRKTEPRQSVVKEGRRQKWAGKLHESMLTETGEHRTVYHGTRKDFDEFWSIEDRPILGGQGALDQYLGPHFAADPAVAESFTVSPAAPGGFQPGGRVLPVKLRIKNPKVIWQPDMSSAMFPDIPSKTGFDMWDQNAIALDMWREVAPRSREFFRSWISGNSRTKRGMVPPSLADEIYAHFQTGRPVPLEQISEAGFQIHSAEGFRQLKEVKGQADPIIRAVNGNPFTGGKFVGSIDDFILFYDMGGGDSFLSGPGQKRRFIKTYQDILKSQGYDAVQYRNTAEGEMRWAENRDTWIVFDKDQIKSVFGRFTEGEPDFLKAIGATGVGIGTQERKLRRD